MEEGNLAILVDAKTEYTKQLVNILKTNIYTSFKSIFSEAKLKCKNDNKPNNVLKEFQLMLTQVPKWNQDQINNEYNQIINTSGCDWIEELITAVFVSHTRILTSINLNRQKGKINLKIPKTTHFIHKCYVDIARLFWKNSYLFDDRGNNFELQKNRREAENTIDVSINETIRRELPVKHILKEYLGNDYTEETIEDDLNNDNKLNLRKMVMREIENCSKEKLDKFKLILENESSYPLQEPVTQNTKLLNEQSVNNNDNSLLLDIPKEETSVDTTKLSENDTKDTNTILNKTLLSQETLDKNQSEPPKEETLDAPKEETLDAPKEETLDAPKEETLKAPKEETLKAPKEETLKAPKEETLKAPKEETLDAPKEETIKQQNIKVLDDLEDLGIEELNLDNMNDLTHVEEIYLDNPPKNTDNNSKKNVKTITLEKKESKSSNYNFFD